MTLFGVVIALSLAVSFQLFAQSSAVDDAVGRALANEEIQTEFPTYQAPEPTPPPGWLSGFFRGVGGFLEVTAPVLKILFYVVVAAILVWLVYFLVDKFEWTLGAREGKEEKRVKRTITPIQTSKPNEVLAPDLNDADKMAEAGHYADAVHVLLIAAIDFIQHKVKGLLSISETSREILNNNNVTSEDRGHIGHLVEQVEKALFAGKQVDKDEYEFCRAKYLQLINGAAGEARR